MSASRTSLLVGLITAVCSFLLAGCSAYRLGPPVGLPFETISVSLAEDRTFTPQSRALLTAQIIEELNRSGRVRVVSDPQAAEAKLRVTLDEVVRDTSVTSAEDSGRPLKLERAFSATLTLSDPSGKQLWLDNAQVSTDRFVLILPTSGLANAEYVEMPTATRALAEATARQVLNVW
jgi:hypothetical protein